MEYRFHRIVHNSCGWKRPSPDRYGNRSIGNYVSDTGFGHEDWNFSFDLTDDDFLYGYTRAIPAQKYGVNLILGVYEQGRWYAVGSYLKADFIEISDVPERVLSQKAADILRMPKGSRDPDLDIMNALMSEPWAIRVKKENVFCFREKLSLQSYNAPATTRFHVPNFLDESVFHTILDEATRMENRIDDEGEPAFTEGRQILRAHLMRERSSALVAQFKRENPDPVCACCGFNFGHAYGEFGQGFCEIHHIKPVSAMKSGEETKLRDVVAVCANCHRMIHRSEPMKSIDEIRSLLHERLNN